jgi:hypothetical protein
VKPGRRHGLTDIHPAVSLRTIKKPL